MGPRASTIARPARDLSAYHRDSSTPEVTLVRGYANTPRIEERPCACGGTVRADPMAPANGVAAHQFTGRHRAWRDANEL